MEKEFNLSEKEIMCNCYECSDGLAYHKTDVKEFIRLLKEEMYNYGHFSFQIGNKDGKDIMNEIIDKLSGDKLI